MSTPSIRFRQAEQINQLTSGHFQQSGGAVIDPLNDRVFVGAATVNAGNLHGVGTMDWAETTSCGMTQP